MKIVIKLFWAFLAVLLAIIVSMIISIGSYKIKKHDFETKVESLHYSDGQVKLHLDQLFKVKDNEILCLLWGWDNKNLPAKYDTDFSTLESIGLEANDLKAPFRWLELGVLIDIDDSYWVAISPKKRLRFLRTMRHYGKISLSRRIQHGCFKPDEMIIIKYEKQSMYNRYFVTIDEDKND